MHKYFNSFFEIKTIFYNQEICENSEYYYRQRLNLLTLSIASFSAGVEQGHDE